MGNSLFSFPWLGIRSDALTKCIGNPHCTFVLELVRVASPHMCHIACIGSTPMSCIGNTHMSCIGNTNPLLLHTTLFFVHFFSPLSPYPPPPSPTIPYFLVSHSKERKTHSLHKTRAQNPATTHLGRQGIPIRATLLTLGLAALFVMLPGIDTIARMCSSILT